MKSFLYFGISKELLQHITRNLLKNFGSRVVIKSEKVGNGDLNVTVTVNPPPKREVLIPV